MAEQPAAATAIASDRSTVTLAPTAIRGEALGLSGVYAEGLVAGLIGACTIALWFLIVDVFDGRIFYTPNVLGSALFGIGDDMINLDALPVSLDTVLGFTWVHLLVFLVIGCAAARLVALAEKEPAFSFGILLLFVIFEFTWKLPGHDVVWVKVTVHAAAGRSSSSTRNTLSVASAARSGTLRAIIWPRVVW